MLRLTRQLQNWGTKRTEKSHKFFSVSIYIKLHRQGVPRSILFWTKVSWHYDLLSIAHFFGRLRSHRYLAFYSNKLVRKTVEYYWNKRLEKTEEAIKNGQSRETGNINIGYTIHRTKKNKKTTTQKSKRMSNTDLYISLIVIKDPSNHLRRDRKPEVYPLFWLCAYVFFLFFFLSEPIFRLCLHFTLCVLLSNETRERTDIEHHVSTRLMKSDLSFIANDVLC